MRTITRIAAWPTEEVRPLLEESEAQGFRFVRRAEEEWQSGRNRFSGPGEAFYIVRQDGRLVGLGGINRESATHGRLRRFYVRNETRRTGIGRDLLKHILQHAHFTKIVLRSDQIAADAFYCANGFQRVAGEDVTHALDLGSFAKPAPRSPS